MIGYGMLGRKKDEDHLNHIDARIIESGDTICLETNVVRQKMSLGQCFQTDDVSRPAS